MYSIPKIRKEELYYDLPDNLIAKFPMNPRNHSKLLIYQNNKIIDDIFKNIHNYIKPQTLIVFNDTKVIPARIKIPKETGAIIEIFLLEPCNPPSYEKIFNSKKCCEWYCFIGNAKKWKTSILKLKLNNNTNEEVTFLKKQKINDTFQIEISWNSDSSFENLLSQIGEIPLPPYIKRDPEPSDNYDYQTIFSRNKGSVASPTASLHFTDEEFSKFNEKNIHYDFITLHITAGTFKPIESEFIEQHTMHKETVIISSELIKKLILFYPNIISSGTTTLRALESLYHFANKKLYNEKLCLVEQWIEFDNSYKNDFKQVLYDLLNFMEKKNIKTISFSTQLMIIPSYKIKSSIGLITNFHQPCSSLLALIAAFVGNEWKKIYQHAINNNYRFLSYGDGSLLFNH
ncbi:MAG: S-adenosylmethionine:tRNA ribosyltransferase-isomerase [Bacteroidales bacterium]|nr:S-adenosylmethionine:tRNA ribosyltransferase-isomerase [Bacteroidales bacterium]